MNIRLSRQWNKIMQKNWYTHSWNILSVGWRATSTSISLLNKTGFFFKVFWLWSNPWKWERKEIFSFFLVPQCCDFIVPPALFTGKNVDQATWVWNVSSCINHGTLSAVANLNSHTVEPWHLARFLETFKTFLRKKKPVQNLTGVTSFDLYDVLPKWGCFVSEPLIHRAELIEHKKLNYPPVLFPPLNNLI